MTDETANTPAPSSKGKKNFAKDKPPPHGVVVENRPVWASDVEPQEIDWLWYPYIAKGRLTMIEGDPGVGKSFLTCSIAADVSAGRKLPGMETSPSPRTVYMLCAEDDVSDTIVPRLIKMDAKLDNILLDHEVNVLNNPRLSDLEGILGEMDAAMMFIDPVVAYMEGGLDMNKANEVRGWMKKLNRVAEKTECAIVMIRHLRKARGGDNALYHGLGSIDFTAAVRSALMVDKAPGGEKVMMHIKSNIGKLGESLSYETTEEGEFHWGGVSEHTPETIAGGGQKNKGEGRGRKKGSPQRNKAEQILWNYLASGDPVPCTAIFAATDALEINHMAVRRVANTMGVKKFQQERKWYWQIDRSKGTAPPAEEGEEPVFDATPFGGGEG